MSTDPVPQPQNRPFEQALAEQVGYWQEVLRLQDWNLDVRLCRPHEMRSDRQPIAQTEAFIHRKDAILRFLHPMDLSTVSMNFLFGEERDYDLNIVHELLHLHFAPFQRESETPEGVGQEQAIEAISRAIVKLHRIGKPVEALLPQMPPATEIPGHYF